MDCNNCVKVCPFNKPSGRLHDAARLVIRKAPFLNSLLVKIDDWLGYGKPMANQAKNFWETP